LHQAMGRVGAVVTARRLQLASFAVLVAVVLVAYRGHYRDAPGNVDPISGWSGQFEQDRWVALDVYSSMRGGYFVELGAYDGMSSSNTLSLERHYDWRGLCIEAGTDKFKRLVGNRPLCTNRLAVVGPEDDAVVFEHAHPSEQEVSWKPLQPEITGGDQRSTTSMRTLLRSASAPSWIDFLSLDVEGREEDILQSWPWDEYSIGALTVEHNFEEPRRTRIRELLKHRGFHAVHHHETEAVGCMQWTERCIPRCPCVDDWFLHPAIFARYNGTVRTNTSQLPLSTC